MSIPDGYRVVQLVQRDPPAEVLRHAQMIPGPSGRYGRMIRYRSERNKTIYEVLHFKAGRPPTREEVLADLRADAEALEARLAASRQAGVLGGLIDRALFEGASTSDLERRRKDVLETMAVVEEDYEAGEAVPIP